MRKPSKRKSQRQIDRDRIYITIATRFMLDHPICEACRKVRPGKPLRWTDHIHHKHGKIVDLLFNERLFIAVCRDCHRWIHDNPDKARGVNLLAPKGQWNTQPPISGNSAGNSKQKQP